MTNQRPRSLIPEPKRLVIVDAHAHAFRAYHALEPMHAPDGFPTNALYGFAGLLRRIIMDDRPDYVAVVFDAPDDRRTTFRSALYPEYKAHRPARPPDLACQIPVLRDIARAFATPILEDESFEADDLIASIVALAEAAQVRTLVQSGDKDLLQLASAKTTLWDAMRGKHYNPAGVEEKLGVPPAAVADYLALVGDSSDNVPGVPGVGPKTAASLLRAWGSLDGIYAALATLPPRERARLETHRELAYLSRSLTRLRHDVPLPCDLSGLTLRPPDEAAVAALCARLGFRDLIPPRTRPPTAPRMEAIVISSAMAPERPVVVVRDHAGWKEALAQVERSPLVGLALAPTDPPTLGLATLGLEAFEVPLAAPAAQRSLFEQPGLTAREVLASLAPILGAPGRAAIAVDAAALLRLVPLGRLDFDPALARRLLGEPQPEAASAGALARQALRDRHALAERLHAAGLGRLYKDVELPLVPVLGAVEARGLAIDRPALAEARRAVDGERRALEQEIHRLAGRPFRVGDARQLGEILFGVLGLPALKRSKGAKASLDALALGELARAHPLPRAVLDLQRLVRLDKDALLPLTQDAGDRARLRYEAMLAGTGRIGGDHRLATWHEGVGAAAASAPLAALLAAVFPDARLATLDLAQLDLRVAAHLSEDAPLVAACATDDPHRALAADALGVAPADVAPSARAVAKHLALGLLYGSSAGRLAADAAISVAEAKGLIAARKARHTRLFEWRHALVEDARKHGHALSLLGRKKLLPELADERPSLQRLGEALAVTATIAGSAADLGKLALVRLHHALAAVSARVVALLGDRLVVEHDDLAAVAATADRTLAELGAELGLRVPLRAVVWPGLARAGG